MVDGHALRWHLEHNHYPPLKGAAVATATAAIEAAQDGDAGRPITLPNGETVPAWDIVESWHLGDFVTEGAQ